MAQSRLERIGTIFSRVTSLIQGGAMKLEDKPLWYDVYKAFPPKVEPCFDRPIPKTHIRKIFYQEDNIRAKFQKENARFLACSLVSKKTSRTQLFINIYQDLEKSGVPQKDLYSKAMKEYQAKTEMAKEYAERNETATEQITKDVKPQASSLDIKTLFNE